ncbi:heavy metal translocating P-type ATPase [Pseudooceanicola sp. LIPI14-2-Ac024]|uniref:heavy metal translocating P-type ATPase n=1 Tax=Pseudooceanicola sp. LIPI14-2-Ac024 TaxID=3344875 RepID=UPI0035D13677
MTIDLRGSPMSACPACAAMPAAEALAQSRAAMADATISLSLPGIHCATCISGVEGALARVPGVQSARVNLTLKRASIRADAGIGAEDLVAVLERAGYEAHELDAGAIAATRTDRAGRDLLMRMAVAGFAMMNVMLLSISVWSGAEDATRDLFHWISAAITLPAIAFAAQPFFRNAWTALRAGRLNMDVPISLAILLALVTSLWETALSGEHAYFDAAIALTFFLLAGRYLDHRTRAIARSAAEELTALEVPRAWLVEGAGERQVPVAELAPGMLVRVRPGARMPVDGEIVEGRSELDRSLLTGETVPVFAEPGRMVSAGEVNLTGPLVIRATAVGADTSLHRMAELVAIAESGRSNYTSLADKAAKLYAPGVHILAALSFLGWWLWSGDLRVALNIAAAVLIITCPCALGLAVPAVTTAASGRLFRRGMLIKHETALERLAAVDTVVFDKTGTLTAGAPEVTDLSGVAGDDLAVALALAEGSAHPLSQALARGIRARGITPAQVEHVSELPGYGTQGNWRGQEVRLGRASWIGAAAGHETSAHLRIGAADPVAFTFTDRLRPGAEEAVAALRARGIKVVMMSGDTSHAVEALADRLGIDHWLAEALPGDKAARIEAMQAAGAHVLMVGDGLNDTAALSVAHVSISPASALDAARVASDIVLLGQDLSPVPDALETAGKAVRRIRENFRIATVYNVIAVPLAVAGLATPLIAALAMSLSSLTVSLNALRLR